MTDREKVVCAIENCIGQPKCKDCPWEDCEVEHEVVNSVPYGLLRDALALLKEQDAVGPEFLRNEWRCGACGHVVLTYCFDINEGEMGKVMANYCPSCGRKVKWE